MRGGSREGAGRKKNGRHSKYFWVTDSEEEKLRKYLEKLRKKDAKILSEKLVSEAPDQASLAADNDNSNHNENTILKSDVELPKPELPIIPPADNSKAKSIEISIAKSNLPINSAELGEHENAIVKSNETISEVSQHTDNDKLKPKKAARRMSEKAKAKIRKKELVNEAFVDWKINLSHNIKTLLKSSKKKAAQLLAEELSKALNAQLRDPTDDIAKRKIEYAEEFIKSLLDKRLRIEPFEYDHLTRIFMERCNYACIYDVDENNNLIKAWRKGLP